MLAPPSSRYGSTEEVISANATGWAHTGDTVETLLVAVPIPAGLIGLGQLEIFSLWTYTNNADNKRLVARFGTAADLTGTTILDITLTTTASAHVLTRLANRTVSSQVTYNRTNSASFGTSGAAISTAAINTALSTFVVFAAQCTTSGADTITLEAYTIRLAPAA